MVPMLAGRDRAMPDLPGEGGDEVCRWFRYGRDGHGCRGRAARGERQRAARIGRHDERHGALACTADDRSLSLPRPMKSRIHQTRHRSCCRQREEPSPGLTARQYSKPATSVASACRSIVASSLNRSRSLIVFITARGDCCLPRVPAMPQNKAVGQRQIEARLDSQQW